MSEDGLRHRLIVRYGERRVVWWLLTIMVSASFSFAIVYTNVQTYDPVTTPATGYADTTGYLKMYAGGGGTGIGAYRPLVPEMAKLLPDLPRSLFAPTHPFTPEAVAAMKFAALNLVFLFGACLAMFALQLGFGFDERAAFIGVMLFLSMKEVVRSAGLPLTDTAFYLFFILCLIAVQRDDVWFLLGSTLFGVATKELVLLVVPLVLLTVLPWRRRLFLVVATVPAMVLYLLIRLFYAPTAVDAYVDGTTFTFVGSEIRALIHPNGLINITLTFGIAWLFAGYALVKRDAPVLLRRWAWLVPIVFVGVLLGMGNIGRSNFTAFPVVIPLAAFGLWGWVRASVADGPA